jgi:protein-S-isoprenylcysteine O-methyltransferase Ste14
MLFLRALFAFLALPAVVGGLVPWLLYSGETGRAGSWLGWPVPAFGLFVVLWCVRDFYVTGRGTLAPWDPPKKLVIVGLYRVVRNPMYVGVLLWIAGLAIVSGSGAIAVYAAILAAGFHLRVVIFEEPTLARLFPEDWPQYKSRVNRWLPKRALK